MALRYLVAAILGALAAALAGAALFTVNPPTIHGSAVPGMSYAPERALSGWADPRLVRAAGEPALNFASRATLAVFQATYRCDYREKRFSIPAAIAYDDLLRQEEAIPHSTTAKLGFVHPAIARCGFCHQRALILAQALHRGGLERVQAMSLKGHVVVTFFLDGATYYADADFGIPPFTIAGPASVPIAYNAVIRHWHTKDVVFTAYATLHDNHAYDLASVSATAERQAKAVDRVRLLMLAGAALLAAIAALVLFMRRVGR